MEGEGIFEIVSNTTVSDRLKWNFRPLVWFGFGFVAIDAKPSIDG